MRKYTLLTIEDLKEVVLANLQRFTHIDLIVGIPRSGLLASTIIATHLNRPHQTLDEFLLNLEPSQSRRLPSIKKGKTNVVIIDDSVFSGQKIKHVKEKLLQCKIDLECKISYAVVFAKLESAKYFDIVLSVTNTPRVFSWNVLSHPDNCYFGVDLDGVLCVDPTEEENDDGEQYINFLKSARILIMTNFKYKIIITSRLEKYRNQTEQWLKKNNVEYSRLVMLNLPTKEARLKISKAEFKASVIKKEKLPLYIESDPQLAKEIYLNSKTPVYCVETGEFYHNNQNQIFLKVAKMGIFQITGQNSNEDYSWGGAYNTSSKEKTASITMKLTYRAN